MSPAWVTRFRRIRHTPVLSSQNIGWERRHKPCSSISSTSTLAGTLPLGNFPYTLAGRHFHGRLSTDVFTHVLVDTHSKRRAAPERMAADTHYLCRIVTLITFIAPSGSDGQMLPRKRRYGVITAPFL